MAPLGMDRTFIVGIIGRALGKALVETNKYYNKPTIAVEDCTLDKMAPFHTQIPTHDHASIYDTVEKAIRDQKCVYMIRVDRVGYTPTTIFIIVTQESDRKYKYAIFDTVNTWKQEECTRIEDLHTCFIDALCKIQYQP